MQYITEYNHDWPKIFTRITEYAKIFLTDNCLFHHIGSTSVPGMPAKNIIDLDIECVTDSFEMVVVGLEKAGYEHKGNLGIHGREAFIPTPNSGAASLPAHHLYACKTGAYELLKHLAYRDYLIANPDRAQWLARKKVVVDASASSRDDYIEKKSFYYDLIMKESLDWYRPNSTIMSIRDGIESFRR